jgi:hypothetical protein
VKAGLAAVILVLAVASGAGAAGGAKTTGTRGAVVSISSDGGTVAIHAAVAAKGSGPDCDSGSAWTPATGKVVRLQDTPCGKLQSDREYDALTLGGSRAVWTDYDYGNHAYCNGPYTATLAKPKPVDTGKCPDEPDNEDMYWEYKGDGSLLVARSYTLCEYDCEKDYNRSFDAVVKIWSVSAGMKMLLAAKDDTKLLDVDAGRILLRDPAKKLVLLNRAGDQVATLAVAAKQALLSGAAQVAVPSGTTLSVYDVASGKVVKTDTMKAAAKLQDVENGVAVYFSGTEVHLLAIATGRDRVVARQKGLVQADLGPAGLFYAYNVPGGGSKPGRVTFIPASALPK